jgi:hypothetical protein
VSAYEPEPPPSLRIRDGYAVKDPQRTEREQDQAEDEGVLVP